MSKTLTSVQQERPSGTLVSPSPGASTLVDATIAGQIQHAIDTAKKLNMIGPIVEQPQYHMFHRQRFEVELDPLFRYNGYGRLVFSRLYFRCGNERRLVVPFSSIYSPLATGMLTGKYNEGIPEGSRWQTNEGAMAHRIRQLKSPEGLAQIEKVKELTNLAEKELGCSISNLALAWTLKNENVSTCIVSTRADIVDERGVWLIGPLSLSWARPKWASNSRVWIVY